MTTKFRVETVMTTSIHLRIRLANENIISYLNRKCKCFFKIPFVIFQICFPVIFLVFFCRRKSFRSQKVHALEAAL